MTTPKKLNQSAVDQLHAKAQAEVDDLVGRHRAYRARQQDKRGDQFDNNQIIAGRFGLLTAAHLNPQALTLALAIAVDRLAQLPDFNPVDDVLADLDFEPTLDLDPDEPVD